MVPTPPTLDLLLIMAPTPPTLSPPPDHGTNTTHSLPSSKAMMDRQKQDELPKMQVGFINAICLPIYKELFELHPPFKPLYDGVLNNRSMWQSLADEADAGTYSCL